jgi:hypothetical protein
LVVGIVIITIAAALGLTLAHVMHPAQQVTNTSIITTDKIGPQFVWLANLSTRWYTSFDVKLFANSTSLLPMPVYAVPVEKLIPKGVATNLTCTCHEKSKQCDIEQLRTPIYSVAPIKDFLFAGFHFIYNICVSSSISNAITLQAYIFEITDNSDYNAFENYMSTGNASSYLFSESIQVKGTTLNEQHTCLELSEIIPRNAFYIMVTKVCADLKKLPILYMKECNAVVQFRDFSRTEYSQSCTVGDDQPCTSASLPVSMNFFINTIDPQIVALLVNASQLYPIPTVLQVTATATNSNVFKFATVMISIVYIIIVCIFVTVVTKYMCSKTTSQ